MIQPWTRGHSAETQLYTEGGDAPSESQPSAEYSDQHLRDTTHKKSNYAFLDLFCSENCAGTLIPPTSCGISGRANSPVGAAGAWT